MLAVTSTMLLLPLLACTVPQAADPSTERAALHAAELDRYADLARQALDGGDLEQAAQAVIAGNSLDPERFGRLSLELETATPRAEPLVRARVRAALYEAAQTHEAREHHRQLATDAMFASRYATPDDTALSRREQAGVTRSRAIAALSTLKAEYVHPIEDAELVRPAAHRLQLMLQDDVAPPPGTLLEAFDTLSQRGIDAGFPAETVWAELTEAAFEGVDPWSSPVWPAQIAAWQNHHDGVVSGVVGVVVDRDATGVVVRKLVPDGSAYAAGMHVGDRFVEVRHEAGTLTITPETTPEDVASVLRGPNGVAVTATVLRGDRTQTFMLERGSVTERTVYGWTRDDPVVRPGLHFVHIAGFRPHTLDELDALLTGPVKRLVLDLRGNGGGDLEGAVKLVDRFVADGPMLHLEGRMTGDAQVDATLRATRSQGTVASPGDRWEGIRLAVLVDQGTGSSAEIVAGALQQSANAHVIGAQTVGKGVSQVLRTDETHGIALQFTNLTWALPDGRHIHRTPTSASWGVQPDTSLRLSPMERFAVGVMQSKRQALPTHSDGTPMPYSGVEWDPALPGLTADPQVTAALEWLEAG